MWLLKIFSAIYMTAVFAAQEPQDGPPVPSLHIQSIWLDVFSSEEVVFNCSVEGGSEWTFTWFRNGQEVQDSDPNVSFSAGGSKLEITAATQSYSGNYTCKGHHKTMEVTTAASNPLELKVYDPPKPSLRLLTPWTDVFENETVVFSCEVERFDWTITWYINEEHLQEDPFLSLDVEESLLNITSITEDYQGIYSCRAHLKSRRVNSEFSNTIDVTVYENIPKPTLTKDPSINPMFVGETVNFTCGVDVSSGWEYQWRKDRESLPETSDTISIPLSNGGIYSCFATRGESTTTEISDEIPQDVIEIPVPSLKPVTPWLDVFPTESVKLICGMDNSSGWMHTWYRDGQEIQANNRPTYFSLNGSTLSVNSASAPHAGQYNCKGYLKERSVSSNSSSGLTLTVYDTKPTVTLIQDPDYKLMFLGESVSFSCHIDVSSGWEYLWYKDGKPLGVSGNKYTISTVGTTNRGSYKCRARRGTNQVFLTDSSQTIHLEVQEKKPKPTITQHPDVDKVYIGESVSFSCNVELASGWEYLWYKDRAPLSINSSSLTIDAANLSNNGTYECMARRSKTMYNTELSDGRILRLSEIPVPSLKPVTPWLDVFPTENVKLICGMDSSSGWMHTWYRDGQEIQANNRPTYFSLNGSTLSVNSASAPHAGQYNCKGYLKERSVSSNSSSGLTLTVYDTKPTVTMIQDPDYKLMFLGESVSFSCHIDVSSGWEYLWYKDGKPLGVSGNKYTISTVGTTNRGSYKCRARRGTNQVFLTDSSQTIHLEVQEKKPKPTITQHPDVDKVYIGESVSFSCNVELASGWEYLWYKDRAPLSINSSSLTIDAANLSNNGTYECMARRSKTMYNTELSDGRILRLSEFPVPSLKTATPWLDVFPTESVKLICGLGSTNESTFTWYKDGLKVQASDTVSLDMDGSTLSISSASAFHHGRYSCSGTLKSRSVPSSFSSGLALDVYDSKARVMLMRNPSHNVMHTGDSVSFSCHVNISSGWEYLWYKDDSPLAESGNNHTITSALTTHSGSYKCQTKRGRNTFFYSDQSQAVRLDVKERPKADIILLTGWSEVFSTDSLVLKCGVYESQYTWNYTWFRDNKPIDLPPSEKYTVTPHNNTDQRLYTCQGIRSGQPSYSKISEHFKTNNILFKRRVLLSVAGFILFGIFAVSVGCIVLRAIRKPVDDESKPEEADLFLSMVQIKGRNDTTCPLFQYITDAELKASSKDGDGSGVTGSETTPLRSQEDQAVMMESHSDADNGGLVSFKV